MSIGPLSDLTGGRDGSLPKTRESLAGDALHLRLCHVLSVPRSREGHILA